VSLEHSLLMSEWFWSQSIRPAPNIYSLQSFFGNDILSIHLNHFLVFIERLLTRKPYSDCRSMCRWNRSWNPESNYPNLHFRTGTSTRESSSRRHLWSPCRNWILPCELDRICLLLCQWRCHLALGVGDAVPSSITSDGIVGHIAWVSSLA
jgi:hypothetical protein